MKIEEYAYLNGLLCYRSRYRRLKRRYGDGFELTLAGEMLEWVNSELNKILRKIPLTEYRKFLKSGK